MMKGRDIKLKVAHDTRIYIKNYIYFFRRINSDQGFRDDFRDLLVKHSPLKYTKKRKSPRVVTFSGYEPFSNKIKYDKLSLEKWKKMDGSKRFEILTDINNFIERHILGKEWFQTILTVFLMGYLCPPSQNLYITKSPDKKRVIIELNPDTSIEDISSEYKLIEKNQKEVSRGHRKIKGTLDNLINLKKYLEREKIKYEEASKLNTEKLTQFELILYNKNSDPKEIEATINNYRKKVALGTGKKVSKIKTFKFKERLTDEELIKTLRSRGELATKDSIRQGRAHQRIK